MSSTLLKNYISPEFITQLGNELKKNQSTFNLNAFIKSTNNLEFTNLELKGRIRYITHLLDRSISGTYPEKIKLLRLVAPQFSGLPALVFPDFVEVYGLELRHEKISLDALKFFTKIVSSEFAIRHFIKRNPTKILPLLNAWAKDKNHHVRRLASEGSRPRLPWSFKLDVFIKNPKRTSSILESLKDDDSLYVRKSVANHLNDIAKDHPDFVLKIAKKWINKSEKTNWILKHGLRTLLKNGHQTALILFGTASTKKASVQDLKIQPFPKIGNHLEFNFTLSNSSNEKINLRIEYAIYYKNKTSDFSKKVFKITEKEFSLGQHKIIKKHSLRQMTTRKHYPGQHKLEILINGEVKSQQEFIIKS